MFQALEISFERCPSLFQALYSGKPIDLVLGDAIDDIYCIWNFVGFCLLLYVI